MQPTKKQITKLKGSWWGKRHEGPVLPKVNSNSLASVLAHQRAKAEALEPQEVETFGALAENAEIGTSALREEILRGVEVPQDPRAIALPSEVAR